MQSNQIRQPAHLHCDRTDRPVKHTSSFVLGQLIVSLAGLTLASTVANAQTSCPQGSSSCLDLYQGTLNAMQTAAPDAQPSEYASLTASAMGALFYPTAFAGGALTSGTMTYDLSSTPSNSTSTVLTSWSTVACPRSGNSQGTYTLEYTISNELEISSDSSVENSSSTFMDGTAELSIKYTSPALTGGVDPEASLAFDYGVEYESTMSTGFGASNSSGTESTLSQEIEFDVPEGYSQTFTLSGMISTYSKVPWSAPVMLTGPLTSVTYSQQFKSYPNPPASTQQVAVATGAGSFKVNANVWIPPAVWTASPPPGSSNGLLASPSGAYACGPMPTGQMQCWFLSQAGISEIVQSYYPVGVNVANEGLQMVLNTTPCTWSACKYPTANYWFTNYAGTPPDAVDMPQEETQYLAMTDSGGLYGYSASWQGTIPGPFPWGAPATPLAPVIDATPVPTTAQLLPPSGQSFTASGTYNSNTLTSNATVTYGPQIPLTQAQISCCNDPSSCSGSGNGTATSSLNAPKPATLAVTPTTPESEAGYVLVKASISAATMLLAQSDERRHDDPRLINGQRRQNLRQEVEQQRASPNALESSPAPPADVRKAKDRNKAAKLMKLKSPMVLKPSQYYATSLPVFKLVKLSVRSDNLTNRLLTVPGPSLLKDLPTPVKTREIHWKPRLQKTFSVKPRETI